MNLDHIILHLSLIPQVGPATIEKVIAYFVSQQIKEDLKLIYKLTKSDFMRLAQIKSDIASRLVQGLEDLKLLEQELELIQRHNISFVTIYSSEYPNLLKNIYLPPVLLYIKGKLDLSSDRKIALVGSRQPDNYGYTVVNKLVPELVENNWVIVSGGALGIDTMVHKATLNAKGSTIAVLGSGLLRPYPAINKDLFTKISEQGAVISSFPLRMSALAGNFPARNRIISGLSQGCVVVQATNPSGALITARFALEQGREVFAVPGSIDNPLSAGCHFLISQGATLVASADDIRLGLQDTPIICKSDTKPLVQESIFKQPETMQEKLLLSIIRPISFDELLNIMQIEANLLQELLWDLQIDGLIEENMGFWVKR